jgi:DNA N-6-adenine-methyltransferase Dam
MTLGSHQATIGKSQDWITPRFIIEQLGPFDLDPCSSLRQPWPCAVEQLTKNGLDLPWEGFVWLNPPFHRYEVGRWIEKLASHGNGIALVHARTEAGWFEPIWRRASAIGFLRDRLYFHRPDGSRADANSGAPAVLAAFGLSAKQRLARCKIPMALVTAWIW